MSFPEGSESFFHPEYLDIHGNVSPDGLLDSAVFELEASDEGTGTLSMADGLPWARSADQSYRDMAEVRDQPDVSPEEPFDYSLYANDYLDQDEAVLENSAETESSPSGSDPYPGFDFAPATTGLYGPAGTGPQPSAHEVPATSGVTPEGHPTPPQPNNVGPSTPIGPMVPQYYPLQTTGSLYHPNGQYLIPMNVQPGLQVFAHLFGYPEQPLVPQPLPFPLPFIPPAVPPPRSPQAGGASRRKGAARRVEPYARKDLAGHPDIQCMWLGCSDVLLADGKTWRQHMKQHVDNDVTGQKRIPCLWFGCGKDVDRSGMFRHAMGTHTSLLHESCTHCDYAGRGDMLRRHIQKKHAAPAGL